MAVHLYMKLLVTDGASCRHLVPLVEAHVRLGHEEKRVARVARIEHVGARDILMRSAGGEAADSSA